MDRVEAIQAILNGKKVRHESWAEEFYLVIFGTSVNDELGNRAGFGEFDSHADGWDIYDK